MPQPGTMMHTLLIDALQPLFYMSHLAKKSTKNNAKYHNQEQSSCYYIIKYNENNYMPRLLAISKYISI